MNFAKAAVFCMDTALYRKMGFWSMDTALEQKDGISEYGDCLELVFRPNSGNRAFQKEIFMLV